MSLFGSYLREMEQDPIFGAHQRAMNRMMNSFFPTGALMPGMGRIGHNGMRQHHQEHDELMPFGGAGMMSPFGAFGGFPDLSMMFNMNPGNSGNAFTSSSFVSISSGPDGNPHVYQASSETRHGPNGVKETRKTLADSRTGTKKMAVGRHLGEQAHVVEREQNVRTGQLNENHEFYNLDEQEAPQFDREWKQRATQGLGRYAHSSSMPAIASASHASLGSSSRSSYVEQPSDEEPEEIAEYPRGVYQPQHSQSQSAVTIEELPASDDETEQLQQQARAAASRRSYPHATTSSALAGASSVPSTSRRSPYGTTKEKRQKRFKQGQGKKY